MTTEERAELKAFNEERNTAFLSLDEGKIRAHYRKWTGRELPVGQNIFWGAVHKAITGCRELPVEFRRRSKALLDAAGLQSLDDGDL